MTSQQFLSLANCKGFNKIQITEETKKENSVYYINDKLEDYTDSEKKIYTIKAEKNGKTEQANTEYLDESIINIILDKIETTDSNYKDEYLDDKQNQIVDEKINVSVEKAQEKIKSIYSIKEKYYNIKNIEVAYSEIYTQTRIINNLGADRATASHNYELYIEATAEKDNEISTYSDVILTNDKKQLEFEKLANYVLQIATIGIEKRKLTTKKYNIVLSNKVSAQIISSLATMLSAEEIHQKKSCLENKKNRLTFSNKLTILEEPNNKKYPGYTFFDLEGTKTIDKELIKKGVIKTYLYDVKEAKVEKTKSTGNKYNGINTRNMFIVPDEKNLKELFAEMDNGIYITSYMGSAGTSVNCSTGNISMQIFGYIIEDGEIKCAFQPAIMTTTIFELLKNIQSIANDLKFVSKSTGSPSLFIKDISISAE